jgi:hypothetical protein
MKPAVTPTLSDLRPAGYFARRWRGELPLAVLFWRDMILIGSAINLGASFLALMIVALAGSVAIAVAVHFAPMPYNLFLFAALWRYPRRPALISVAACAWLLAATLV